MPAAAEKIKILDSVHIAMIKSLKFMNIVHGGGV
jgi:hypothetical protein